MANGSTNGNGDRRSNGTFAPGNTLSAGHKTTTQGRPRREMEAQAIAVLRRCVSPEDLAEIVSRQVQRAKGGNLEAAKFVVSYLIGRPREFVELSSDEDSPLGKLLTRIEKTLRNGDDE